MTDWQPPSLPAVKIEQAGGSNQLLIKIMTLRRSTDLTPQLFEVLEEESLDVLDFNRSPNEDRELNSIKVKVIHISYNCGFVSPLSLSGYSHIVLAILILH